MTITAEKRSAALQFGRPFRITLPIPGSFSTPLSRAHVATCYYLDEVTIGIPRCGWVARRMRNGFVATRAERIWMSSGRRVSIFDVESCP